MIAVEMETVHCWFGREVMELDGGCTLVYTSKKEPPTGFFQSKIGSLHSISFFLHEAYKPWRLCDRLLIPG